MGSAGKEGGVAGPPASSCVRRLRLAGSPGSKLSGRAALEGEAGELGRERCWKTQAQGYGGGGFWRGARATGPAGGLIPARARSVAQPGFCLSGGSWPVPASCFCVLVT